MNQKTARFILGLFGWRISGSMPEGVKKAIVVMAPHTSNWDFVIGWLGYSALGLDSKYLIKKEVFFFPVGYLFRKLGGIPVDRGRNRVMVQVGDLFKRSDELIITITPEATRSLNPNWKKGFYVIAQYADVPLVLGFLDYRKKTGGLGPMLKVSGDYDRDMITIESFYKDKTAKFPKNFNLSPENLDKSGA